MMQRQTPLIALSLLLAFGLGACDKPGPAETAGRKLDQVASDTSKKVGETVDKVEQKMSEQGAKTAQAFDDSEITAKIKAALLAEPGLKSLHISVDTVHGVVTLSGSVDAKANSDQARALAASVVGVREVNNQLVVTPGK